MKSLLRIKSYLKVNWVKVYRPKTQSGFGIIEVMIAASLLMIIAAGMTALIGNMQKEQQRQQLFQTLTSLQSRFKNAIENESAWRNTVNDSTLNPNMTCVKNGTACSATYVATAYATTLDKIVLKDGSNQILYDGRATAAAGSAPGFTMGGAPCSTFSYTGAGSDACPIGYYVTWRAEDTSSNPRLTIVAKLVFNPSSGNNIGASLNAVSTSTTLNKYDSVVSRTALATSKSFTAVVYGPTPSATTGCAAQGFGTCAISPAWTTFGSSVGSYTITDDPFGLVNSSVTNAIRLRSSGSYKCTVQTSAFAVNGVQLQLYNSTAGSVVGTRSSSASQNSWTYANISLDTIVNTTTANTDIVIRQSCQSSPGAAPLDQCALGFNSASTYNTALATAPPRASINCVVIQ